MAEPQADVPALQYSAPRIYLDRHFRYRNKWMPFILAVLLGMGAAFVALPRVMPDVDTIIRVMRIAFTVGGLAMLAGGVYCAIGVIVGWADHVQITADGIVRNRRLHPWSQIHRVEGVIYTNGLRIAYSTGGRTFRVRRTLQTTPPLTKDEYAALAAVLTEEIAPSYPNVRIAPEARSSD